MATHTKVLFSSAFQPPCIALSRPFYGYFDHTSFHAYATGLTYREPRGMAKTKKISRHAQYPAAYQETLLERERQQKFLGSARIAIDVLSFDQITQRRQDDRDTARLLKSFEMAGCLRIGSGHHVPALIDKEALAKSIDETRTSSEALFSTESDRWPMLKFPVGFRIQCLHGKHRVEAGTEYLWRGDRWWVVDFYSPGRR